MQTSSSPVARPQLRQKRSGQSRKERVIIFLAKKSNTFLNLFLSRAIYLSFEPNFRTKLNILGYLDELNLKFSTMSLDNSLDKNRLISLALNLNMLLDQGLEGDIAELGVYRGNTLIPLAYIAKSFGRKAYAFDTFSGFSEKQLAGIDESVDIQFQETSLEQVQKFADSLNSNIEYIQGTFPNPHTLLELSSSKFVFVHLDCDLYEPTLSALRFFWPRMTQGGQIFLHDYISRTFHGINKALKDYETEIQYAIPKLLLPDLSTTCVLIKSDQ